MTTVNSTWTRSAPPPLTGTLPAAAWSGSGTMAIPRGTLMAQNDGSNLYIGLDLTAETGAADPNDYFWFIVDINNNGVIDSNRDKLFSDWPGSPDRLGMWLMAGPDATWPASNTQVIASKLHSGFGPSMNGAANHRQWQIAFALSDLNITIDPAAPAPVVRFGLRIATLGGAVGETPANPLDNFSAFHEIVLATSPAGALANLGPVVGAVGLIGTGFIGPDGYCTIPAATPNYFYPNNPQHAAFSGTLNFIGNEATLNALWAAGARKYTVSHRFGATTALVNAAAWSPILQTWANFEIVGSTDVWKAFAPDPSGYYPMVNPATPFTIQNLIFQWTTSSEPDGLHQFDLRFFNPAGGTIAIPPVHPPPLTLKLDNQPVTVDLVNVLHANAPIPPCSIITLASATDGVQIVYEAFDPEGDMHSFAVTAEYGHGEYATIYSDNYAAHAAGTPEWQGVASDTRPVPPAVWVPPVTCAYLFRISAWSRTTNGYEYPVLYSTDFQTVTLIKPGVVFRRPVLAALAPINARGFATPAPAVQGRLAPVRRLT